MHLAPPFRRVLGLAAAGTLAFGFTAIASVGVAQATALPSWSASASSSDGVTTTTAVPAGICAIEWDVIGGSGGADSDGTFNGLAGEAYTVQPATEGDTFTLYPGTAGADGVASTAGALGGTNGYTADTSTAGAAGGLDSDSGIGAGGGGAASVVEKDGSLYLLAFGGDGTGIDGGAGGGGGADQAPADDPYFDDTLTTDGAGDGTISGTGLPCAPSAPYLNWVSAGDRQLSIDFTDDGTGDLPAATYEYTIDRGSTWTTLTTTPSDGRLDATITGLNNGTEYTVQVRGVAANGAPSDPSNEETGTPMKVATAPRSVTATVGPASLTVRWTAATAGDFPIDHYEVVSTWSKGEYGGDEAICKTASATALTCTGPAQAGKKHDLAVYAVDTHDNEGTPARLTSASVPFTAEPPTKNGDLTPASGTATSGVQPGSTMTVSGSGYAPFSTVTVLIYSSPQVLTTVVADASGKFTVTVTVPAGLEAGNHTLVASGLDPSGVVRYVTLPVTVAGSLAYTGFDVALPLTGGLIALGVGATLMVVARRRKVAVAEPAA